MGLFYHRVEIYRKPAKRDWEEDKFKVKEVDILVENDNYVVLNDDEFTKLEKKDGYSLYYCLNKERINIIINDNYFSDSITYTLYSEHRLSPSKIKEKIENEIESKYGWLMSELDLSIIK